MADQQNVEQIPASGAGAGGGQPNPKPADGAPADKGVAGAGGGAGAGAGAKKFEYTEDRSDWIPRHRLNEASGKLTTTQQELATLKGQLEAEQKRTRVLAGLEVKDAKTQEAEDIREAIYQLVPELGALKGLTKDQLNEVLDAAKTARSSASASWERHANTVLDNLDSEAATSLGVEKLSDTQQRNLRRAYRDEIMSSMQERQVAVQRGERQTLETLSSDNDLVARHERGDKTLLKEFVKAFLGDWFEPAKRSVNAQIERRGIRPVPRGERTRTPLAQGEQKVDLNNNTEFKKALLAARGQSE